MKEFNKIFSQIAYRYSTMQVFDDFLCLAICALSCKRMEDEYLRIIKGYSKEEITLFSNLLGALILDYEKQSSQSGAWFDGLGEFFMENNSKFGQDARGQFFTPEPVCTMLALMTGEQGEEEPKNECRILDPAAGSGRMLIAMDRLKPNNRFDNFYVAADIDSRCVKMCTLNMFLYGLKGAVIHMNSITMEVWGGYRVYLGDTGLGIRPLSIQECFSFITYNKKSNEVEQLPIIAPEPIFSKSKQSTLQLTLF